MNHMSAVRPFQAGDAPAATAIVRGLPDYFTEDVPDKVEHDVFVEFRSIVESDLDDTISRFRIVAVDMKDRRAGDVPGVCGI